MNTITIFAMLLLFSFASTSMAATIDFNDLTGADGEHFQTYTENGFTVLNGAQMYKMFSEGNPAPDLYCSSCFGSYVMVIGEGGSAVRGGARVPFGPLFTFTSIDIGNNAPPGYLSQPNNLLDYVEVTGFVGRSTAFVTNLPVNYADGFQTLYNVKSPTIPVNLLQITVHSSYETTVSYNIDNIVVNLVAAPEPGTMSLVALVLAGGYWFSARSGNKHVRAPLSPSS